MSESSNATGPGNGRAAEAATPPRPRPVRRGGFRFVPPARRWARQAFSRESLGNGLRSLGWVVPLTVLIWVYAEREQVKTETMSIPIDVVSKDADHVVTFADNAPQTVMATISGPKAKIDAVRDLKDRADAAPLRIEVNPGVGQGEQKVLAMRLADNKLFADNAVTLTAAQPEWVPVYIDQIVVRNKVPIKPPPGSTFLRDPVFDPPTVSIRGPSRAVERVEAVYADLKGRLDRQVSDGPKVEFRDVGLKLPPDAKRVTIADHPPVTAVVESERPEDYEIPAVRVRIDLPPGFLDGSKYRLNHNTTIFNVKVRGPKDAIAQLRQAGTVEARLYIENKAAGPGVGKLKYDLPPQVQLVPDATPPPPQEMSYTLQKDES